MKEKIPEELRKEFEQAVLNADLDHWMVDNDRQFLDKIWDAVDKLFNQEVEKRIKERMPSDILTDAHKVCEWISDWIKRRDEHGLQIYGFEWQKKQEADRYNNWLLSRLTCSEKPNNSQNTEGGEG